MVSVTSSHVPTLEALLAEADPLLALVAEYHDALDLDARNELCSDERVGGIASWVERMEGPLVSRWFFFFFFFFFFFLEAQLTSPRRASGLWSLR